MKAHPLIDLTRPENAGASEYRFNEDYPSRLITRRMLGQNAEKLLAARRSAPNRIGLHHRFGRFRRPPC